MLQTSAVEPRTLGVLKKLMKLSSLQEFVLVGGTALALHKGHRLSIDIDMFSSKIPINRDVVLNEMNQAGTVVIKDALDYALFLEFDGVKLDVLKYQYEWLKKPFVENGIRVASVEDISAMKLSAITKRGLKKDFYDLYFLIKELSLSQMLDYFRNKYPDAETYMVLKSLNYFEDAEENTDPVLLKEKPSWEEVKKTIRSAVKEIV